MTNTTTFLRWRNLPPFLILLLSATLAYAQSTSTVTATSMLGAVSSTDLAGSVLSNAVGQAFYSNPGTAGSGSGSTLGSMFATFNAGLLAVGVFWFSYNVVAGTVQTAEGGEFMGQRFSTVWMPIRFCVGIFSLIPAFNGFCGAQVIMMYFAKMGIGLANLLTIAALSSMTNFNSAGANIQQDATATAQAMFISNVCMQAVAADTNQSSPVVDSMGSYAGEAQALPTKTVSTDGLSYTYSRPSPNGVGGDSACGSVSVVFPSNAVSSSSAVSGGTGNLNLSGIRTTAMTAHQTALAAMDSSMASLATQYVNGLSAPNGGSINFTTQFQSAAQAYSTTVSTALQGQVSTQANAAISAVTSNIQSQGWMALGSWYQTLAVVGSMITNTAGAKPALVSPSDPAVFPYRETYVKALSGLQSVAAVNDAGKSGNSIDGVFAKAFTPGQSIINGIATWSVSGAAGLNPILEFKNLGDGIIWTGAGALAAFAIVKGASEAANNAATGIVASTFTVGLAGAATGAVKGVLDAAGPFVVIIISGLFFFGVMLATYIPMLPFITWFGGIMAWYANFFEGLISAPIGAFAHLEAEGEGMGQRSQHAYLFLFGVLLRPSLMVFGFFVAAMSVKVLGSILLVLFAPALANAQWNSMTGVVMIAGYVAIFISLALTLVHGSFNLIHIIPDQGIMWAGGHISGMLGRDADDRSKGTYMGGISIARQAGAQAQGAGARGKQSQAGEKAAGPTASVPGGGAVRPPS